MYQLSQKSKLALYSCHRDLILIAEYAIRITPVDFGISEGHRSVQRQKELYELKRTQIDGVTKLSNHNYSPSKAFDFYAYVNGKLSYKEKDMVFLAGVFIACAEILKLQGIIRSTVRWGGNWDGDGEIISDQGFIDTPHIEIL